MTQSLLGTKRDTLFWLREHCPSLQYQDTPAPSEAPPSVWVASPPNADPDGTRQVREGHLGTASLSSPAGANAWSGRSLDLEPLGAWGCAYICLANPEKALGCSCQVLCGDPIPCFTDLGALSFCTSCCFGGSTCFQGLQPSPQVIHQAFEFPSKAPRRKIPPN